MILTACGTSKKSVGTSGNPAPPTRDELVTEAVRKAMKDARDAAKVYEKDGYKTFIGALPMARQVEESYLRNVQKDAKGQPLYLAGDADVTGGSSGVAQAQALHQAKVNLASQVNVHLAGLVKQSLGEDKSASLGKFLQATQELLVGDMERVDKVIEIYRQLPDNRYQVLTRVMYNTDLAMQAAEKRLLQSLENEAEDLHKEVSEILNRQ